MRHPDRKAARNIDIPGSCQAYTDVVFGGKGHTWAELFSIVDTYDPPAPAYQPLFGEMHGHSSLSDGTVDPDVYYTRLRDEVGLNFAVLTDHDHGGVGKESLWVGSPSKWDAIAALARKYYEPGKFTTLLAYERNSYPFYTNLVVYYRTHQGDMVRGVQDGEFTAAEMRAALQREDLLLVPHDTYSLCSGADLSRLDLSLMTPLMEIYSRGDATEYWGDPRNVQTCVRGGFWQDALARGAKMGCIAGGDAHDGTGGTVLDMPYPENLHGLTGVWAKENTLEGIWEALRARRCYAIMGAPFTVDFRINGHYMGEEFTLPESEDRHIFYQVTADVPVKWVTVLKNNQPIVRIRKDNKTSFFDYAAEKSTDYYYLRVELEDGRVAWTSPIWITKE